MILQTTQAHMERLSPPFAHCHLCLQGRTTPSLCQKPPGPLAHPKLPSVQWSPRGWNQLAPNLSHCIVELHDPSSNTSCRYGALCHICLQSAYSCSSGSHSRSSPCFSWAGVPIVPLAFSQASSWPVVAPSASSPPARTLLPWASLSTSGSPSATSLLSKSHTLFLGILVLLAWPSSPPRQWQQHGEERWLQHCLPKCPVSKASSCCIFAQITSKLLRHRLP